MVRWALLAALTAAAGLCAQPAQVPPPDKGGELKTERPPSRPNVSTEAPPEEDAGVVSDRYGFNPLQSEKAVKVGNFYAKQGNRRAALARYQEATKWNHDNSEAWLLVGQTAEKLKESALAKEAYAEYLKLEPNAKDAAEIRKRAGKLK
jgi:tetratricopeptide (TPR) repeat protein